MAHNQRNDLLKKMSMYLHYYFIKSQKKKMTLSYRCHHVVVIGFNYYITFNIFELSVNYKNITLTTIVHCLIVGS